jgi:SAM-dependent methyltransferase
MTPDVVDLRNFYASPLGQAACRSLTKAIGMRWSKLTGLHVMGLGYGVPYLDAFLGKAERVIAAMPEKQGVIHWPPHSPSATVLVVNTLLPFADQSLDRVLLVHSIETEESPADLLDEVWRVLSPGGSVLVVVPNRRGLWARMDTTPFGQGQPYSRSQMTSLLRHAMFSPIHWSEELFMPPIPSAMMLRAAPALERIGAALSLPFAGVHVIEATKLLYRPVAVRKVARQRSLSPFLVPAGAQAGFRRRPLA